MPVKREDSFTAFVEFLATHAHVATHVRVVHLHGPLNDYEQFPCVVDPRTLAKLALSAPTSDT